VKADYGVRHLAGLEVLGVSDGIGGLYGESNIELAGLVIPAGTKQILIEENLQLASVPEPASIGTWLFFIGTGLAAGYRRPRLRIEKVTSFWSGRCVVHRHNPQGHRV